MHPNSNNIGEKIFVVYFKLDKMFSRRVKRRIAQIISFEHNLCTVVCIGIEEPLRRGQPDIITVSSISLSKSASLSAALQHVSAWSHVK